MEYFYYFYNFGNHKIASRIINCIKKKDFEGFMKFFNSPDNGTKYDLPDEIIVNTGNDDEDPDFLDVTDKDSFLKITYTESEHG